MSAKAEAAEVEKCAVCDITADLKRCVQCRCVMYCSRAHQMQDWPAHKTQCQALRDTHVAKAHFGGDDGAMHRFRNAVRFELGTEAVKLDFSLPRVCPALGTTHDLLLELLQLLVEDQTNGVALDPEDEDDDGQDDHQDGTGASASGAVASDDTGAGSGPVDEPPAAAAAAAALAPVETSSGATADLEASAPPKATAAPDAASACEAVPASDAASALDSALVAGADGDDAALVDGAVEDASDSDEAVDALMSAANTYQQAIAGQLAPRAAKSPEQRVDEQKARLSRLLPSAQRGATLVLRLLDALQTCLGGTGAFMCAHLLPLAEGRKCLAPIIVDEFTNSVTILMLEAAGISRDAPEFWPQFGLLSQQFSDYQDILEFHGEEQRDVDGMYEAWLIRERAQEEEAERLAPQLIDMFRRQNQEAQQ